MKRTYLISDPTDSNHLLEIDSYEDRISIHTNNRPLHQGDGSSGFSRSMATQLRNGLSAILSGQFDRAVTEAFLRVETDAVARDARIAANEPSPRRESASSSQPELDQL